MAKQIAPLLKVQAEPVRLRLMSLIASHPGGEACVCDLTGAFELPQPAISHYLKVPQNSGLVDRESRCSLSFALSGNRGRAVLWSSHAAEFSNLAAVLLYLLRRP